MPHLPENPSLEHLRRQARTLLRQFRAADAEALALLREHHPRPHEPLRLADAQLVVARSYGFASWPALRRHMDVVGRFARSPHTVPPSADAADELLRLGCVRYGGDSRADQARAAALLAEHPELSGASLFTAAATGDAVAAQAFLDGDPDAANRPGGPFGWEPLLYLAYSRIGGDALPVARLLLDHGADPNAGYLWEGTYPFTALTGAFGGGEDRGNQPPHPQGLALARMLLEAGADPNDSQALYNRQFEPDDGHLRLLIEFGLGTDRGGPWHRLLHSYHGTPAQLLEDQLSAAAQFDRPGWARLALAAGADPDGRGTAHPVLHGRTPYETAVHRGNLEVAELLRAAGATAPTSPTSTSSSPRAWRATGRPRSKCARRRPGHRGPGPGASARCGADGRRGRPGVGGAAVGGAGLRRARRTPDHAVAPGRLRRGRRAGRAAAGARRRPRPARPLVQRHAAGVGRAQPPGGGGRAAAPAHPRRPTAPLSRPHSHLGSGRPPRLGGGRPAAWGQPASAAVVRARRVRTRARWRR